MFLMRKDSLEKEIATPSRNVAWGISWTEEPGGLPSTRLQRIRHYLVTEQQQHAPSKYWPCISLKEGKKRILKIK